ILESLELIQNDEVRLKVRHGDGGRDPTETADQPVPPFVKVARWLAPKSTELGGAGLDHFEERDAIAIRFCELGAELGAQLIVQRISVEPTEVRLETFQPGVDTEKLFPGLRRLRSELAAHGAVEHPVEEDTL